MVMKSMMASQKTEAMMTSWGRLGLYLPCMKKRTTSEALKTAMVRATIIFKPEKYLFRPTSAANRVGTVQIISTGNVVLDIFVVILDGLDSKKHGAEDKSGDEEPGERLFPAGLRGPDSHGHSQAAADEDDSVDGAPRQFDGLAGFAKNVRISGAIECVGHEQAAEEK